MPSHEQGLASLIAELDRRLATPELRTDDRLTQFDAEMRGLSPEERAQSGRERSEEHDRLMRQAAETGDYGAFNRRVAELLQSTQRTVLPDRRPPLEATALKRFEEIIGFSMPPDLAAIYMRVADGGFGPALGLLPMEGIVTKYQQLRRACDHPPHLLPILDTADGFIFMDGGSGSIHAGADNGMPALAPDLVSLLGSWMAGKLRLQSFEATLSSHVLVVAPSPSRARRFFLAAAFETAWKRLSGMVHPGSGKEL